MNSEEVEFAQEFSKYRERNIRAPIERYTIYDCMLQPLLDKHKLLDGKRVLDLACGHGHYTRQLKALNCDYILGVDLSPSIIQLAQDIEDHDPKGIEYMVADVNELVVPGKSFDLITAFYLFDYAQTRKELLKMVQTIYMHLEQGKHFIGLIGNVLAGRDMFNNRKYGITRSTLAPLEEDPMGDTTAILVTLYDEQDKPVSSFINYHYSPRTYLQVFKEAGFKSFKWVPYQCDPNSPDRDFYDDLVKHPPSIGIVATK